MEQVKQVEQVENVIGGDSNLKLLCSRSETWINLSPLKLLWDLDPSVVDFAGDVGAPFGHGPVLGPANVRTYASHEVNVI